VNTSAAVGNGSASPAAAAASAAWQDAQPSPTAETGPFVLVAWCNVAYRRSWLVGMSSERPV
jgi:hypothetical protein